MKNVFIYVHFQHLLVFITMPTNSFTNSLQQLITLVEILVECGQLFSFMLYLAMGLHSLYQDLSCKR
jgi:hypothetical protein